MGTVCSRYYCQLNETVGELRLYEGVQVEFEGFTLITQLREAVVAAV
jgi:hypothetical protein